MQKTHSDNSTRDTIKKPNVAQLLEKQNIFYLIGIDDGTEEEKELFLDDLQEAIWEDFLEHDCKHLITNKEMAELQKILVDENKQELQKQAEALDFLTDKISDLEDLMLEKALELKEEMLKERIISLRDLYSEKEDIISILKRAEEHCVNQEWKKGIELLNSIPD